MDKGVDERPTYVAFNGAVGALTGGRALQARIGRRVRIGLGDAGPDLTGSFHVTGEIFDNVYPEGSTGASERDRGREASVERF